MRPIPTRLTSPGVDRDQRDQEIRLGLRYPNGRMLDYERDPYFIENPLALSLPPHRRKPAK